MRCWGKSARSVTVFVCVRERENCWGSKFLAPCWHRTRSHMHALVSIHTCIEIMQFMSVLVVSVSCYMQVNWYTSGPKIILKIRPHLKIHERHCINKNIKPNGIYFLKKIQSTFWLYSKVIIVLNFKCSFHFHLGLFTLWSLVLF